MSGGLPPSGRACNCTAYPDFSSLKRRNRDLSPTQLVRCREETVPVVPAEGTDLTSTLYQAMERPHHKAILTHADEASESVPAGLLRRARSGVAQTLIYI